MFFSHQVKKKKTSGIQIAVDILVSMRESSVRIRPTHVVIRRAEEVPCVVDKRLKWMREIDIVDTTNHYFRPSLKVMDKM